MAAGTPINFDLSVIQGLPPTNKFNGNLVSDIQSAYSTYLTGAPVGKGGQYAVSAQKKYGYASIADAAAGYLQAAGIPILPNAQISVTPNNGVTGTTAQASNPSTVTTPDLTGTTGTGGISDLNSLIGSQYQNLADAFKNAFGTATYEPPLQSQYYSGTPANIPIPDASSLAGYTSLPPGATTSSSGGISLTMILIVAGVGIGGYYLYKRYHKG
jgi:hypothetical protein